ncbi:MBL fold metallo-hydrolase [Herbiconiux sp. SYSU D00978]|uniref:MBL fold metallo-hydrolase n=1 Tax=Herbiconiux sp. SYSU D00978 TaxID=2812562 RepID=UPI001A9726A3|nr:MBL fold metallo-hydrolase [Herbiconiux sp. SYSU D00978]
MLHRDVAPGIHRIEHADTNFYLVQDGQRLLLVDAGLAKSWRHLLDAVHELGRRVEDIEAVVLTHGHFDHVGVAERVRKTSKATVYVHPEDDHLARHPYHYQHEHSRTAAIVRHPKGLGPLGKMLLGGAIGIQGVRDTRYFGTGVSLGVPGSPIAIHVPGHTDGSVALWFEEQSALLTGDALVTLDPYTAEKGPRTISGAATKNHLDALASLTHLTETNARLVLPGHGEPWTEGIASAVELARTPHD